MSQTKMHTCLIFKGQVQGVGFRITTLKMAQKLGLRGFVSNLEDGSVKAVFEADLKEINPLIDELKGLFFNKIEEITISYEEKPFNFYKEFTIKD